MPRIVITSVLVQDQAKALAFYTEKLNFQLDQHVPMGEYAMITLVSPEDPDGPRLMLEPMAHSFAEDYQFRLRESGIQAAVFGVSDAAAEAERLRELGVRIVQEPVDLGPVVTVVVDDTVGNLISLAQMKS